MTAKQYFKELSKALSTLPKNQRQTIVMELKSTLNDADDYDSLVNRFGAVNELASQYLDGEDIKPTKTQVVKKNSKRVFMGIGVLASGVVAFGIIASQWFTKDPFDYSNREASELNPNNPEWQTISAKQLHSIEISQSKMAIYWHDKQQLKWQCQSAESSPEGVNIIRFQQNNCLVYLPKQAIKMDIFQADVTLVEPAVDLNIKTRQARLRIAEGDEPVNYQFNLLKSQVNHLVSKEDAKVALIINATESQIEEYVY